jgi:hypothetical protein
MFFQRSNFVKTTIVNFLNFFPAKECVHSKVSCELMLWARLKYSTCSMFKIVLCIDDFFSRFLFSANRNKWRQSKTAPTWALGTFFRTVHGTWSRSWTRSRRRRWACGKECWPTARPGCSTRLTQSRTWVRRSHLRPIFDIRSVAEVIDRSYIVRVAFST